MAASSHERQSPGLLLPEDEIRAVTRRRRWLFALVLLVVGAAGFAGYVFFPSANPTADEQWAYAQNAFEAKSWPAAAIFLRNVLQERPHHSEARKLLAQVLLAQGDGAGAEKEYRHVIRMADGKRTDPVFLEALLLQEKNREVLAEADGLSDPDALVLTGYASLRLGEAKAAGDRFSRALVADPKNVRAALGQVEALAALGEREEASRRVNALAESSPRFDVQLVRGQLAMALRRPEEALPAFESAYKLRPYHPEGRIGLALVLVHSGDFERANELLTPLTEPRVTHPSAGYIRGVSAFRQRQLPLAQRMLREVLGLQPAHQEALILLSATHAHLGEREQARQLIEKVGKGAKLDARLAKIIAAVELQIGRPEQAIALIAAQDNAESDSQLAMLRGSAEFQAGRTVDALQTFQRVVVSAPEDPAANAALGAVTTAFGDPEMGMAQLEVAHELLAPAGLHRVSATLFWTYLSQGEFEKAEALVAGFARRGTDDPLDYENLRGLIAEARGDRIAARALYIKASGLGPMSAGALNRARLSMVLSDFGEAEEVYQRRAKERPGDVEAAKGLALVAIQRQQPDVAIELLQRSIATNPTAFSARVLLAQLYLRTGQVALAAGTAEQAARLRPRSVVSARLLAAVQSRQGGIADAARILEESLKHWPDSAALHFERAVLYGARGAWSQARQHLEKANTLSPNSARVQLALGRAMLRQGEVAAAQRVAVRMRAAVATELAGKLLQGEVDVQAGKYDSARTLLLDVMQSRPSVVILRKVLQLDQRLGEPERGLARLDDWLRKSPNDTNARLIKAVTLHGLGRESQAAEEYEKVLSVAPGAVHALNNLAWIRLNEDVHEAARLAKEAVRLEPNNPDFLDTYGWILVQAKQPALGLPRLQAAFAQRPSDPTIGYHLAAALHANAETDRAGEVLDALRAQQVTSSDLKALQDKIRGRATVN